MKKANILIVEDEQIIALDLKKRLEKLGYNVVNTVTSGEKALIEIKKNQVDLVLLDIKLIGKMSGTDTGKKITKKYKIPIIYNTAYADVETVKNASQSFPYGYLIKPFNNKEINAAIEIALYKKDIEKQIFENEQWLSKILNNIGIGILVVNDREKIELCNAMAEKILNNSKNKILKKPIDNVLNLYDLNNKKIIKNIITKTVEKPEFFEQGYNIGIKVVEHKIIPVNLNVRNIKKLKNNYYIISFFNISERKRIQDALKKEKELAQITLKSIGDGVITTNSIGHITYLNPKAELLTSWTLQEAIGRPFSKVLKLINEISQKEIKNPINTVLQEGAKQNLFNNIILLNKEGREYPVEVTLAPIKSGKKNEGMVVVVHDETETKKMTNQLAFHASHDLLTGLVNRKEFELHLDILLKSVKTKNENHALLFIDIDQMKVVNDTCGHNAGDELLRQFTAMLKMHVRNSDVISRIGGDEFGILIEFCPLDKAKIITNDLRKAINNYQFIWGKKEFKINASFGLVAINAGLKSKTNILSAADEACYIAKNKGGNRLHIFNENDKELVKYHGEMQWITQIIDAIKEERFTLYFQKIAPLTNIRGKIDYYEVLARILDKDGSIIPPYVFIPPAERYNLMPLIDRWVVNSSLEFCEKALKKYKNKTSFRLSINLSGNSLSDEYFLTYISKLFNKYDITPGSICFEITETAAITNLPAALELIKKLKTKGCLFALDDFGSGISSFTYLKNIPVDYLKIDGSIIKGIADDPIAFTMVNAINRIAHVMSKQTIAEFVENEEIYSKLKEINVDFIQGDFIGKPGPLKIN